VSECQNFILIAERDCSHRADVKIATDNGTSDCRARLDLLLHFQFIRFDLSPGQGNEIQLFKMAAKFFKDTRVEAAENKRNRDRLEVLKLRAFQLLQLREQVEFS